MAKNRYVNTHFWSDNYIANLDPIEKLLFMYFLTNPFTNISGVYEINIKQVPLDTGIDKEMVLKVIERFSRDEKIYFHEGYIIIVNFPKHQEQGSNKVRTGIANGFSLLPEKIKKFISERLKGIYTLPYLTKTEPNLNLIKPNQTEPLSVGFLPEEKKDQEPVPNLPELDLKFNKFWKFYNRREGKVEEIREMFKAVVLTEKDYKDLITATRNYNAMSAAYPIDKVKYPINFLKCYQDFIKIDN